MNLRPFALGFAGGLSMALAPRLAAACGASIGGVPGVCDIGAQVEQERPKIYVGISASCTNTVILFSGDSTIGRGRATQERQVANITLEARPAPRVSLAFAGGAVLGGSMVLEGRHYDLLPGIAFAAAGAYTLVEPKAARPFVVVGLQLSMLAGDTQRTDAGRSERAAYTAFDLRGSSAVGFQIARVFSPYVVGRVFGGPILFRSEGAAVQGTDLYKYQGGAGFSLAARKSLSAFVEAIAVGERGITAGIALTQ